MVDAVISFTVDKLGNALIGETLLLLGVRSQVQELRTELIRMQCFLKDADAKEEGDHRVKNWILEIRNIAYNAEDVVDTFILKFDAASESGKVRNFIKKALMSMNLKYRHRIGKEIQAIRSALQSISVSRETYGINDLGEASSSDVNRMKQEESRNPNVHVVDEDVIGLEKHTNTLLTELQNDNERRCVVSIVGDGGLGKTTLAKKIYNHDTIMSRFDCRAWCSISQYLNLRYIVLEIIKKTMDPNSDELSTINSMSENELVEKLYHYLEGKRYFVVVDDIWSIEDWERLSPLFPNGEIGSKLLLTTRNRDVASRVDPGSLQLEPPYLKPEDSWELLCKKAFPKHTRHSSFYPPRDLEEEGRQMVDRCGGLPLAICVLGGLLANKRSINEWKFVHRNIISNFSKGKHGGVMGILALSYNDLPNHLKPCFLYLGLFPENSTVGRKKLIQLWIAEGFISNDVPGTMEDVGKREYLHELIQRCMIQVDKDVSQWGKTCRIHDLMRDLCLIKAKEMNFLDRNDGTAAFSSSHGDVSSSRDTTREKLRRFVFKLNNQTKGSDFYFNSSTCALRTLIVQNPFGNSLPLLSYQNIKLLRVLDLNNVTNFFEEITKSVCKLTHLRYLGITGRPNTPIPSSIGNLRKLQVLKVGFFREVLPGTIAKLVQLRHLEVDLGRIPIEFPFEKLINLHTLDRIQAGNWIKIGCLKNLSLRKLCVQYMSREQTDILINEVVKMRSSSPSSSSEDQHEKTIRVLSIQSNEKFNDNILDSLSCCHNLHRLRLDGGLNVLEFQESFRNLSRLELKLSSLREDPMTTLQYLPKLKYLVMAHAYTGEEVACSAEGFPQLRELFIYGSPQLMKFTVDEGGMPLLKKLYLHHLSRLSMLPEGLRFITTLEKLEIGGMPTIRARVVRDVGEDWPKVKHIPFLVVQNW